MKKNNKEDKKYVAIYTRVSSEEQKKEGLSLDAQKKKLVDYAQEKEWIVFKVYTDAGVSGKSIKGRKAFSDMLQDARNDKFSGILITKFDRAFRNVKEALITVDELHELGIDFISMSEQIDTTSPMGKMVFTVISAFAQLERELTAGRVNDINQYKFSKGVMIGKAPLGYKWSKRKKQFVVDPEESAKVKDIFDMSYKNIGYREICKKYRMSPSTYYKLIRNKFYIGLIGFSGEQREGSHDPIIEQAVFNHVNDHLNSKNNDH